MHCVTLLGLKIMTTQIYLKKQHSIVSRRIYQQIIKHQDEKTNKKDNQNATKQQTANEKTNKGYYNSSGMATKRAELRDRTPNSIRK